MDPFLAGDVIADGVAMAHHSGEIVCFHRLVDSPAPPPCRITSGAAALVMPGELARIALTSRLEPVRDPELAGKAVGLPEQRIRCLANKCMPEHVVLGS